MSLLTVTSWLDQAVCRTAGAVVVIARQSPVLALPSGGTVSEHMQQRARDMTVRELTVQLGDQIGQLMKEEMALAKTELFASARQSVLGGGMLGAAAVIGLTCWLVMVAAAIAGIAAGLPVWAAALIVGGALGAAAGALALLGRWRLARGTPPLTMTIGSIKNELNELTARVRARR
jgi:hypothetical protein